MFPMGARKLTSQSETHGDKYPLKYLFPLLKHIGVEWGLTSYFY